MEYDRSGLARLGQRLFTRPAPDRELMDQGFTTPERVIALLADLETIMRSDPETWGQASSPVRRLIRYYATLRLVTTPDCSVANEIVYDVCAFNGGGIRHVHAALRTHVGKEYCVETMAAVLKDLIAGSTQAAAAQAHGVGEDKVADIAQYFGVRTVRRDDLRSRIAEDFRNGIGVREVSRKHGIGVATASRYKKELGL